MTKSLITNIDRRSGRIVPSASDGDVLLSSAPLGWNHITAELHRIPPAHQPEHLVRTHRLMLHTGAPARFEFREGGSAWTEQVLKPGDLSLLAHGMPNEPRWHDTLGFLAIGLDPAFVASCFHGALPSAEARFEPVRGYADPTMRTFSALMMTELAQPTFHGALFGDTLALSLARHLFGRFGSGVIQPRGALTGRQLGCVLDHVKANLAEDVGLDTLARQAGVSPFHFARLFRAATGVSPHRFVLRLKVEHAQALIRAGRARSLTEVAVLAGFFDQAHFTRSFKLLTGVTPSAYAAQI